MSVNGLSPCYGPSPYVEKTFSFDPNNNNTSKMISTKNSNLWKYNFS